MYQLLALLTGIVLAVMISVNGGLTDQYGVFPATVIIHVIGSLFAMVLCLRGKERKTLFGHWPWWIYLGGVIGVFTTVFQNFSFGRISMTSIIALGLFAQTVMSLLIDHFGFFGMQKRRFEKTSLFGLIFSLIGILALLDGSVTGTLPAVFAAIASGITVVLSRTVNTRLSGRIGALPGSLVNHLTGLGAAIVITLIAAGGVPVINSGKGAFHPLIYCGGVFGVFIVYLFNITVPKISAVRLTVLTFAGQIFTGVLIDLLVGHSYSQESVEAGVFISMGIVITMITEQISQKKRREQDEYWARVRQSEEEYHQELIRRYAGRQEM